MELQTKEISNILIKLITGRLILVNYREDKANVDNFRQQDDHIYDIPLPVPCCEANNCCQPLELNIYWNSDIAKFHQPL